MHPATSARDILIAGLGSIGRRHLANLQTLGWSHIRLYRTGHSVLPDADVAHLPVEYDLPTALARRPLAVIVSNPSSLHLQVALAAARAGAHLLIEKPLSHDLDGISALEEAVATRQLSALVGFQFRFNPGLRQIKTWLTERAIGEVVSAHVHWGEHLPDMHPWENYRTGYAARPDLGGGVLLTLCHPFDYLRWLLGDIEHVSARETPDSSLGIAVESAVDVTLAFSGGVHGNVHLNFLERPRKHCLTVVGSTGTLTWADDDHVARRYDPHSQTWETMPPSTGYERNDMFLDEMRHFLRCVQGDARPECTLQDGRQAIEVTLQAKRLIARARASSCAS